MAQSFARFIYEEKICWGKYIDGKLIPIFGEYETTKDFIIAQQSQSFKYSENPLDCDQVEYLSPITNNQQFIAQATNYKSHVIEVGLKPEDIAANVFFTKAQSSLCGANSNIVKPNRVKLLDYEVELGLVIGKEITKGVEATENNLTDYVAGLVIVNDISARDVQIPEGQFFKGKSFRTFSPTGPFLVILQKGDEKALAKLELKLSVNGEIRQNSNLDDMIFKPAQTINELSTIMDLHIGDLIITGTPGGVALRAPPMFIQKIAGLLSPKAKNMMFLKGQLKHDTYLKNGDKITTIIKASDSSIDLGVQNNIVVDQ